MIKRVLCSCLLAVTIAGFTIVGAVPASAGLSPTRSCKDFETGDHVRRLSVCSRVWISDSGAAQSRGVVEMHTYISVNGRWIDVTSQSITINDAEFFTYRADGSRLGHIHYGADVSQSTCRVNGPSGNIGCGAANTGRVAFYSGAFNGVAQLFLNCVHRVSWRDDRGIAHYVKSGGNSYPDQLALCFND